MNTFRSLRGVGLALALLALGLGATRAPAAHADPILQPNNVRADLVTSTSIQIRWDYPSSAQVDYFALTTDANSDHTETAHRFGQSTRQATFSGLSPNQMYSFIVEACWPFPLSRCIAASPMVVTTLPSASPPAPTNLRLCGPTPFTPQASGSQAPSGLRTGSSTQATHGALQSPRVLQLCQAAGIRLTWEDNAATETRYEFAWNATPAGRTSPGLWTTVTLAANDEDYRLNQATVGATYRFRVRACNSAGCSAWAEAGPYTAKEGDAMLHLRPPLP